MAQSQNLNFTLNYQAISVDRIRRRQRDGWVYNEGEGAVLNCALPRRGRGLYFSSSKTC